MAAGGNNFNDFAQN